MIRRPPRALGFGAALALVVGNMIGSGIYLLPATLAPMGVNGTIGWSVTIAGAMCLAYVFARLSAALPLAGGPYAFARAAFGPGAGFAVAWSYWVLIWTGNAAVAVAVVSALSVIAPALGTTPGLGALTALALIWTVIAVNIRGVRLAGQVQLVTACLKLLPLLAVILFAGWRLFGQPGGAFVANPAVPVAPATIAAAAAITFWGFLGIESATVPADKVANAGRIVPRVTMIGTGLTGLVYLLVSTAVTTMMPAVAVAASPSPIAAFLGTAMGGEVTAIVALFAAISALGALNGFIMLQGEVPRAAAAGGVFPAWFAAQGRRGTPVRAHLVSGVLVTVVALANYTRGLGDTFAFVATISLAAGMLAYLASALAAIRLIPGDRPLVAAAIASAAFVCWMIYGLGLVADFWGGLLVAAGAPIYWRTRRISATGA